MPTDVVTLLCRCRPLSLRLCSISRAFLTSDGCKRAEPRAHRRHHRALPTTSYVRRLPSDTGAQITRPFSAAASCRPTSPRPCAAAARHRRVSALSLARSWHRDGRERAPSREHLVLLSRAPQAPSYGTDLAFRNAANEARRLAFARCGLMKGMGGVRRAGDGQFRLGGMPATCRRWRSPPAGWWFGGSI